MSETHAAPAQLGAADANGTSTGQCGAEPIPSWELLDRGLRVFLHQALNSLADSYKETGITEAEVSFLAVVGQLVTTGASAGTPGDD